MIQAERPVKSKQSVLARTLVVEIIVIFTKHTSIGSDNIQSQSRHMKFSDVENYIWWFTNNLHVLRCKCEQLFGLDLSMTWFVCVIP